MASDIPVIGSGRTNCARPFAQVAWVGWRSRRGEAAVIQQNWRADHGGERTLPPHPFEEQHYSVAYWARRWNFSPKTVREWFRDEYGPGILRQRNTGRHSKRDYTTIMISASAAARVYAKRTAQESIH